MGSIYKRTWKNKDGTIRESAVWWVKYYLNGRPIRESAETTKESEAKKLLKLREGDVARGVPVTARVSRITFKELAQDMITDYKVNGKRSLDDLEQRLNRHVLPVFGARRAASITTADINDYKSARQDRRASNGQINRELTAIKRAFSLGLQAGKILMKPHIPMLREDNVRRGFFERAQFDALRQALPTYLQPVVQFAYITGWRIPSEVLRLTWTNVDFLGGQVRLDPGTTKNGEGRSFPFTTELRSILATQHQRRPKDAVCPWVFQHNGKPIGSFYKAWNRACYAADLPCEVHFAKDDDGKVLCYQSGKKKGEPIIQRIDAEHIPHDFRRTAVRNLVRAGIPERVAMQLTGHKTRSVFERYNIVSETDLSDAARRLDLASGTVLGTVHPFQASSPTKESANLLHSNNGPVAQTDRAAVS